MNKKNRDSYILINGGLAMRLHELILYNTLSDDPVISRYIAFIKADETAKIRRTYFELVRELVAIEMPFEHYLYTEMIRVNNPVIRRLCNNDYNATDLDTACLVNDLDVLSKILTFDIKEKLSEVADSQDIFGHLSGNTIFLEAVNAYSEFFSQQIDPESRNYIRGFVRLLKNFGTGVFALDNVFYINQEKQLTPVSDFNPLPWDEIYDYEIQKHALLENTKALVKGHPFQHVLLEGASGTGKSSSVKAAAQLFRNDKLRLIQLYKGQLRVLPKLLDELRDSVFKFIIFIDDLSFEVHDDDYKLLKSYIEGGIINETDNIAFYVTSNRQHLIKEMHGDRKDEVHLNDFIQETTSLSAQFGLHLSFSKPNQREYFEMVSKMLDKEDIKLDKRDMEAQAKRWSMRHGGMSGRIAMQFVKQLKMTMPEN
jgi:predicted AAA+ superfamily ATPase